MMGSIGFGWLCPKCNTVYAPSQTTCAACSAKLAFGTTGISSVFGTVTSTSAGLYGSGLYGAMGTIFIGPRPSATPPPPVRDWKEERAEQIVKDWNGGKWGDLRRLIEEALEEAEDAED